MDTEQIINDVFRMVDNFSLEDLPGIDLYMDQVTTYLNNKFKGTKRHEDDKLLTKTMINNYAKSHLLPPPEKKKYNNNHLIALAMIFFFKNVISINDVTTILTPLMEEHFDSEDMPLDEFFNDFFEKMKKTTLSKDIMKQYKSSISDCKDAPGDNKEYMENFQFIAMLCYDMFLKKMIVEKTIDSMIQYKKDEKENDSDIDK